MGGILVPMAHRMARGMAWWRFLIFDARRKDIILGVFSPLNTGRYSFGMPEKSTHLHVQL